METIQTLTDLIVAVKEQNLDKDALEDYRDQMSHIYADMQFEMASIEKSEALFMDSVDLKDMSVAGRIIKWKATALGLRLIVLKRYVIATKEILISLSSSIYSLY